MDGIRRFGLHPLQEETVDEQSMVDMTSLGNTSGNQTVDSQGHRDEITVCRQRYVLDGLLLGISACLLGA